MRINEIFLGSILSTFGCDGTIKAPKDLGSGNEMDTGKNDSESEVAENTDTAASPEEPPSTTQLTNLNEVLVKRFFSSWFYLRLLWKSDSHSNYRPVSCKLSDSESQTQ